MQIVGFLLLRLKEELTINSVVEFLVVHNGIITNYKDIKSLLVSIKVKLSKLPVTNPTVFSESVMFEYIYVLYTLNYWADFVNLDLVQMGFGHKFMNTELQIQINEIWKKTNKKQKKKTVVDLWKN